MPENRESKGKRSVAASSATAILRVILTFVLTIAVLVLAGVAFTRFGWRHLDPTAIPVWFLRLSPEQWIALGIGIAVAILLVVVPCARMSSRKAPHDPDLPLPPPPCRIVERFTIIAVLALYNAGLISAYRLSRAIGHSRDWAIIHSVYSWVYVGYSFFEWMVEHRKQPLGKALHQFLVMIGL
jgi:hypothetical protein